jgi:hypothetical protein
MRPLVCAESVSHRSKPSARLSLSSSKKWGSRQHHQRRCHCGRAVDCVPLRLDRALAGLLPKSGHQIGSCDTVDQKIAAKSDKNIQSTLPYLMTYVSAKRIRHLNHFSVCSSLTSA